MSGKPRGRVALDLWRSAPGGQLASPWFGPPRLRGRPWIATFAGIGESFVDAFFRGVSQTRGAFTEDVFPRLLPVRDFSEPPGALFDGSGAPSYVRAHVEPADDERAVADELDCGGAASFEDVLVAAGFAQSTFEAGDSAFPPAHDASRAAWLRKLYLPMHCHFHLVACEIAADRPGLAQVPPGRVIEAGMIVRRFIADRGAARARWEDWIPSPRGGGMWVEIADEDMTTLSGTGRTIDPVALPRDVFGARDVELRRRLGAFSGADAELGLSLLGLSALPRSIESAKGHAAFYGYLPLMSNEQERPTQGPPDDLESIATEFADMAERHLTAHVLDQAEAIRERVRAALLPLLVRLRDTLPPKPAEGEVASAYRSIKSIPSAAESRIDDACIAAAGDLLGFSALTYYEDAILKTPDPVSRWSDAVELASAQAATYKGPVALSPWFKEKVLPSRAAFSIVMRDALWQAFARLLPSDTAFPEAVDGRVLAALLLWVRRHRVGLLTAFYQAAFAGTGAPPPSPDEYVANPSSPRAPLRKPLTTGPLGAELAVWIAIHEGREQEPVSWPAPALPPASLAIHRFALTLEAALADVDVQGAGAGGAYATEIEAGARRAEVLLATQLGSPELVQRGIDTSAQPERGLFVFPGPSPDRDSLAAFANAITGHYLGPAMDTDEALRASAGARRMGAAARYDAGHLYAVWCHARLASMDPALPPRVVWSKRTEVFSLAEPMDVLGLKPVAIAMPDLPKLLRDIPRMKQARALPFAAIATPRDSGLKTGPDPRQTEREWGIARVAEVALPVLTLCAWVAFKLVLGVLTALPGFAWTRLLRSELAGDGNNPGPAVGRAARRAFHR